ncbi:hypothetical protein APR04_002366 [Promicromonospora umidemergens]|uniref:Acetyltransferase (GNAT) family protein n=1 Tax=Promicromonospora umidemergens TaxID=629679 RepID=A0ABP8WTD9_9MICO|nr:hypothetical protein [Promicromonospora umidemergens]MCP2283463.1 hypothetical protein [Promicromonospora umidemergens]
MDLELTDRRHSPSGGRLWVPFEGDERFNPQWWNELKTWSAKYTYVSGSVDGVEVARAELDHMVDFGEYVGVPALGIRALEVQFIEVATSHRGSGIGTQFVRQLAVRHTDRVLVAFSESADEFWASLGWTRYDHPEGWPWYRPLFIQPE